MPQDPNASFDQTVLDLIEHSPTGAVPHTPTYQDALKRLCATHQVYPSADHKGGYVTVRSLAGLPCFSAQHLETFLAGEAEAGAVEPDGAVFDRYVGSLPEALRGKAEACRSRVVTRTVHHRKHGGELAQDPVHALFLVPGSGPHPGLPGNYLYGSVLQVGADVNAGPWSVQVHDGEDGAATCDVSSRAEALARLEEVLASAPFKLDELESLGFLYNYAPRP